MARRRAKARLYGQRARKIREMFKKGIGVSSNTPLSGWRRGLDAGRLVEQAPEAAMVLADCRFPHGSNVANVWEDEPLRAMQGYVATGFDCAKALHGKSFRGFDDVEEKTKEEFARDVLEFFIEKRVTKVLEAFRQGQTRVGVFEISSNPGSIITMIQGLHRSR